ILDEVKEIYNSGDYDAESANLIMDEISVLIGGTYTDLMTIYNSYGLSISAECKDEYAALLAAFDLIMSEIYQLDESNSEEYENLKAEIKAQIESTIQEFIKFALTLADPISAAYVGDVIIPSTVEYGGITYTVTSIGVCAFNGSTNLTSIEIPSSVTSIGDSSFYSCTSLSHITSLNPEPPVCGSNVFDSVDKTTCILTVPAGSKDAYASADVWNEFNNIEETGEETSSSFTYDSNTELDTDYLINNKITELIIGEDVVSIPEIFSQMKYLETVYYNAVNAGIAEALEILKSIFANCPNLKTFVFGDKVQAIPDYLLRDCVGIETIELPSSITSIGKNAFDGCTCLKEIVLPSGIKEIGIGAFKGCINLESVEGFGSLNITAIPDSTFHGCVALEKIEIPSGVTSIGNFAFYYCENITTIEITNNITIIGDNAFGNCSKLTTLEYNAKKIESLSENAFSGCPITSMTIGEKVEFVPMELNQLTNITTIYYNAVSADIAISAETLQSLFSYFKNLTNFIIGETVKTIVDYVLKNCVSIESIELPGSITSIGKGAFHGCTGLKEIKGFGNLGITAL
ncbi:MAG: leucine-rich repeat domain-containing protein, partial [Prevotella sp.]|nr:leucine-rich repeat domain-containing protein [Prevotella sp.]